MVPPPMKLNFDCYQALLAQDARFDGRFFVAVKTTGIYCRPVCPARPPLKKSCLFVETAAAAERAGFRPCLRCRPELAPGVPAVSIEQALFAAIRARAIQGDSVDEVAKQTGYSARQLRRLMVQGFGVTPVEIMQTERLLFAKKLLQETDLGALEVALSAGFGSVRRFNTLFRTRYGQTPTTLRRPRRGPERADVLHLRLSYRPPLAWTELLDYLARRAVPSVEAVSLEQGNYARTMACGGQTGWLTVSHSSAGAWLEVTLPAALAEVSWSILTQLRALFDLDASPASVDAQLGEDPLLGPGVRRHPGLRVPGAWTVFELAVRAVLGQQVSVKGASTLAARLAARFGRPVTTPFPHLSRLAPSAKDMAAASLDDIAAIGLPRARALALQELAAAVERGELSFGPAASVEEAVTALRRVRGIGEWTAQYVAMRALRFPDAFPAADLGVRKALAAPGQPLPSEKLVLERAAAWRPWRAYAAIHLWQTVHDALPENL
ncbi:MAG: DNA-3-methyladenine glycosylase 2 family protein [Chthoniobacteraceae bacterium]|nr:DNA-3-methyladenine glycosylase 2 family protein [Chthoniobacteraceae bacterium]